MPATFPRRVAGLLRGCSDFDGPSFNDLKRALEAAVFSSRPTEVVAAGVLMGSLQELLQFREAFVEETEKAYGIPWNDQFSLIKAQIVEPWADCMDRLGQAQDEAIVLEQLSRIVQLTRKIPRIRPK